MTWRELVFEICNQIPEEQFDDEAKIVLNEYVSPVRRLQLNSMNFYTGDLGRIDHFSQIGNSEPIIKQGEWTIE